MSLSDIAKNRAEVLINNKDLKAFEEAGTNMIQAMEEDGFDNWDAILWLVGKVEKL